MVQGAPQVAGRFSDEIRMYKSPPPEVSTEAFYETDPAKPYKRGWSIQTVSPLPITWAEHVTAQGHWGTDAARIHARLHPLGHPGRAMRTAAPTRQPGHLGRGERPPRSARGPLRLQPMRQRQTTDQGCHDESWRTSCARRAPRRSSPSSATPTSSAAPAWRPPRTRSHRCRASGVRRRGALRRRRQHHAHPGFGQPGADHHGAGRARRRLDDRPRGRAHRAARRVSGPP